MNCTESKQETCQMTDKNKVAVFMLASGFALPVDCSQLSSALGSRFYVPEDVEPYNQRTKPEGPSAAD